MKMKKKVMSLFLTLVFIVGAWIPANLAVNAEETSVAVYHEYITTEEEAIDSWYAIARGIYLQEGTCGITRAGKGKVTVSATTTAHSVCDKVKAGVYLDESSNGGSSFGQIGSYYFSETNTSSCHGSKAGISVTSGWMYMARGAHSVTEGSTTESTTSQTSAITAS